MLNENFSWKYIKSTGRYAIRHARILYPNFEGNALNYNPAGRRNFRIEIPEDLAHELEAAGVYVRGKEVDDPNAGTAMQYTIKISVYPGAQIHMNSGGDDAVLPIDNRNPDNDSGNLIDSEFRLGRIINGEALLSFYVSKNSLVAGSSPYLRLDELYLKARRSELLDEYEQSLRESSDDEEDAF